MHLNFIEKKESGKEESKEPTRKFDEEDIHNLIANTYLFDEEQLGYVEFLECLVRIADAYPFTDEELAEMVNFEMKMIFFMQRLEDKYNNLKHDFRKDMLDEQYQPRVVVDEELDEDDLYDNDNN